MGHRLSEDRQAQAVSAYLAGSTLLECARDLGPGVGVDAIKTTLRNAGVPVRTKGFRGADTAQKARMVEAYQRGATLEESGAVCGLSWSACLNALIKAKVPRRKSGNEGKPRYAGRTRKLNTSYWQQVDTEDKAYWLGFCAGDGHVTKHSLKVKLERSDRGHLETLCRNLGYDGQIVDGSETDKRGVETYYSVVCLNGVDLVASLNALGIPTGRKSHTIRPWEAPPDLEVAYYRGLFDADGSIFGDLKGINLVGSRAMIEGFCGLVARRTGHLYYPKPVSTVWVVDLYGSNAQDVVKLLYEQATIALERKAALALKVMDSPPIKAKPRCTAKREARWAVYHASKAA